MSPQCRGEAVWAWCGGRVQRSINCTRSVPQRQIIRLARFDLRSPLSRDEIAQRLRGAIDSNRVLFGSKSVIGWADRNSFNLRVRIDYRNSFRTILRGQLADGIDGTRIRCHAGMPYFAVAFMTVWFLFIGVGVAAIWPPRSLEPGTIISIALPIFGVALVAVGRWFARQELPTLIAFLEDTIEAERAA
jgi:hypothetical protein